MELRLLFCTILRYSKNILSEKNTISESKERNTPLSLITYISLNMHMVIFFLRKLVSQPARQPSSRRNPGTWQDNLSCFFWIFACV